MEPTILINGQKLPESAAMTVRVAIESLALSLSKEGLGEDEAGKTLVQGYMTNINLIRKIMY